MEVVTNQRSYIRLNAIRFLLLGISRRTLCQQFCRTNRMLRLWIERFNRGGIDALITKARPGRPAQSRTGTRARSARAGTGKSHHPWPRPWDGRQTPRLSQETTATGVSLQPHRAVVARIELPSARAPTLVRTPERGKRRVFREELGALAVADEFGGGHFQRHHFVHVPNSHDAGYRLSGISHTNLAVSCVPASVPVLGSRNSDKRLPQNLPALAGVDLIRSDGTGRQPRIHFRRHSSTGSATG